MATLFVDPGSLRTELSLQASTVSPDGLGGHSQSWIEVATLFARIEPVAASSVFGADQSMETVTHRVTIRWRPGVASGMRFVKQSRIFDIVTAHDPDDSARYLVCRAREAGQ
ncbi:phage head closure protein [Mesorhizobium marinum]|uniref:Phage head closure protein n=1 Tax=Mesorhizobium marinum TaxID=3228790 RepID=A0ABV3R0G3_9HYPH